MVRAVFGICLPYAIAVCRKMLFRGRARSHEASSALCVSALGFFCRGSAAPCNPRPPASMYRPYIARETSCSVLQPDSVPNVIVPRQRGLER